MRPSFWKALEALGASGSAICNWRHHLGDDWETCVPFLKPTGNPGRCVIDPRHPLRMLELMVDGDEDFVAVDGVPHRPPPCSISPSPFTKNGASIPITPSTSSAPHGRSPPPRANPSASSTIPASASGSWKPCPTTASPSGPTSSPNTPSEHSIKPVQFCSRNYSSFEPLPTIVSIVLAAGIALGAGK